MNTNDYQPLSLGQKIEILEAQLDVMLGTIQDSLEALLELRDVTHTLRAEQSATVQEAFRQVYGEMVDPDEQEGYDVWLFENEPISDADLNSDFDADVDGQVVGS